MRRWTFVMRILTSSPIFVPGTKTTKFAIRASPSPSLPISSILASYTFPSSTGTLGGRKPDPEYDIHHSMRRPSAADAFRIRCTVFNDIGVGPRKSANDSRFTEGAEVLLDVRGPGQPQAEDQTDDTHDEDDEPDRGDEPVERAERVEGGVLLDRDPQHVVEPRAQRDPRTTEHDQGDSGIEEECLAAARLLPRPYVIGVFDNPDCAARSPSRTDLRLELLSALRAFRRVGRDGGLACRALGDEALRRGHDPSHPLLWSGAIVVCVPLSELIESRRGTRKQRSSRPKVSGRRSRIKARASASRAREREFARRDPAIRPASGRRIRRGGTSRALGPLSHPGPRSSP